MASAFSHAIVALAMGKAFQNKELSWRELSLGALCSVVPDLDVIGFYFGIQYGDMWGHRGLTHSVVFAALLAGSLVAVWYRGKPAVAMTGLVSLFLSLHRFPWCARCDDKWRVGRGVFLSIRYDEIFFPLATGPCVSHRRQRIFQRIWCSGPGQRSHVDLAAILCGVRGVSCSPTALVSQIGCTSLIAIARGRSSGHPCRSVPASRALGPSSPFVEGLQGNLLKPLGDEGVGLKIPADDEEGRAC